MNKITIIKMRGSIFIIAFGVVKYSKKRMVALVMFILQFFEHLFRACNNWLHARVTYIHKVASKIGFRPASNTNISCFPKSARSSTTITIKMMPALH
jgi:hypothetical protein